VSDADERTRRERGISAYASQFEIPESEVEAYMGGLLGERMAGEAINAQGGGAWADEPLSLRDRSLVVLASLITQGGAESRLRGHVRWAVAHGVSREQIEELTTLLAIYAGYPRASTAMETIRAELAELEGS
jgi:4-carboxymuconolactone decarboxylase